MNQRGFATLEVILMVMVIGILASIAVPRFTNVTTAANTAKIQSDLSTIDTAISIYYMENGSYPSKANIDSSNTELKPYLQDIGNVIPPKGQASLSDGNKHTIKATVYAIIDDKNNSGEVKASLDGKTAEEFSVQKKT